jgi:hypothetical protein
LTRYREPEGSLFVSHVQGRRAIHYSGAILLAIERDPWRMLRINDVSAAE